MHAQFMTLSKTKIILSAALLGLLAVVAATPNLLGGPVSSALHSLAGAERNWLLLGAAGFAAAFGCTVAAWRAAFAAAGGRISPWRAGASLGVGAMVNSFAPAKLGDAVKVALCSKAIDAPARLWTAGGVYAALAAARSLALAALLVVAFASGAMPLWPILALCAAVAVLAAAAFFTGRLRRHARVAALRKGLAALEHSPRALASVLGWTFGMVLARLAATAAVAAALDLPHPLLAALLILPALDLASALPLTPGSIGIGSGAVAVALASRGIGMTDALGVGFAIQGLETIVSVTAGSLGTLYLVRPGPVARRWAIRVATVGASAAAAASIGSLMFQFL